MKPSKNNQEKETVDETVDVSFDELRKIVKKYWVAGKNGDVNKMIDSEFHKNLNLTKGYLRQKISKVLNGHDEDYAFLEVMYLQVVVPRREMIAKAVRDESEIRMQRIN